MRTKCEKFAGKSNFRISALSISFQLSISFRVNFWTTVRFWMYATSRTQPFANIVLRYAFSCALWHAGKLSGDEYCVTSKCSIKEKTRFGPLDAPVVRHIIPCYFSMKYKVKISITELLQPGYCAEKIIIRIILQSGPASDGDQPNSTEPGYFDVSAIL